MIDIQIAMERVEQTGFSVERTHTSPDVTAGIQALKQYKEFKPTYTILVEEVQPLFLRLFEYLPQNLHKAIVDYMPHVYPDKEQLISELSKLSYSEFLLRLFKWKALGYYFGLMPFYDFNQGYFYFEQPKPQDENAILKGIRNDWSVKALRELDTRIVNLARSRDIKRDEYIKEADNEWKEIAGSLVTEYKIHLMPQGDPTPTIIRLLTLLKNDPELQNLIAAFKVMGTDTVLVNGVYYPRIVVYPAQGKDNAQRALNKLYVGLKDIKGLGVRPRYNAKVNDLIWVAQGDSGYKNKPEYQVYFEKPDFRYFKPDLTGKIANYHLIHPETGKEII